MNTTPDEIMRVEILPSQLPVKCFEQFVNILAWCGGSVCTQGHLWVFCSLQCRKDTLNLFLSQSGSGKSFSVNALLK